MYSTPHELGVLFVERIQVLSPRVATELNRKETRGLNTVKGVKVDYVQASAYSGPFVVVFPVRLRQNEPEKAKFNV